ncbi:MAG: M28 family peptidase, partial [Rhodothermia bacterium]
QNVLFIAFSGEEQGLIGSKHFASNPTIDLATDLNYMINLDMVGRLKENRSLIVGGAGTSPSWIPLLEELGGSTFNLKFDSSGIGPSDHTSFYLKDRPVLHLFTGQHREYHKPSDDSHLINYDGIREIASFVVAIIERTDEGEPLAFAKTRDVSQGRQAARFKVSLGVMPDYGWDGQGLRVDAVLDDRPGSRAGLEDGDVIIRIGDSNVTDIYTYMEALGKLEPGVQTTVVVKRGDEELEKPIRF